MKKLTFLLCAVSMVALLGFGASSAFGLDGTATVLVIDPPGFANPNGANNTVEIDFGKAEVNDVVIVHAGTGATSGGLPTTADGRGSFQMTGETGETATVSTSLTASSCTDGITLSNLMLSDDDSSESASLPSVDPLDTVGVGGQLTIGATTGPGVNSSCEFTVTMAWN